MVAARTAERESEPAQQHRHIGALRAVIGVELIEHEILKALCHRLDQRTVGRAQQHLVEHLVVGEQDVGRIVANRLAVVDEPAGRVHPGAFRSPSSPVYSAARTPLRAS